MPLNIDDLNNLQIDVLKEIGNIGAGNAATALAQLINKRVDMDVPKIKILPFNEVNEVLGGAETLVVGILLQVSGNITGDMMLILKYDAAQVLVNILLGRSASIEVEFNDFEMSALKEVGNILSGSYLLALSSLTNLTMQQSVPDIAIDMSGAILSVPAIEFGKVGDQVLFIETEFSEGESKVIGDFFLIPDLDSYEIILRALGVIS